MAFENEKYQEKFTSRHKKGRGEKKRTGRLYINKFFCDEILSTNVINSNKSRHLILFTTEVATRIVCKRSCS